MLASGGMTRNLAPHSGSLQADAAAAGVEPQRRLPAQSKVLGGRSLVLVGLMGAGKSSVGRRLAGRLGLPFRDADAEIERAAGCTIAELFARYGERAFREGERRVISRLLAEGPFVIATGGGAWMDPATRAAVRHNGVAIWLRARLPVLVRRVATRQTRPLLAGGDPAEILQALMAQRHPVYAEADLVVESGDDALDVTVTRVLEALHGWREPRRLAVALPSASYEVVIGEGLLGRAGTLLASALPQRRAVVVTDTAVAALHLTSLLEGLAGADIEASTLTVPPGEGSKSLATFGQVTDGLLAAGVERQTAVIALGGGVVGDLAGFAAASTLRGLPFVQVPTTLLAQVDSSVGGKTGINTAYGKNLLGAFHQPRRVLADIATLATLPARELRAGYAEIVKAGLIADSALFAWCEQNGAALLRGDAVLLAEAVYRACAFKAAVVGEDEREERSSNGRALLNLGHTFAHALEATCGYDGSLLHGEAVAIGLGLAFALSVRLGICPPQDAARVLDHLAAAGVPSTIAGLDRRFSASVLVGHMRRDKKHRDGRLAFVLARGVGQAFTSRDVPPDEVMATLRQAGCEA